MQGAIGLHFCPMEERYNPMEWKYDPVEHEYDPMECKWRLDCSFVQWKKGTIQWNRSTIQSASPRPKSFHALGESQQKRSERMMEAERERHAEFITFQKEQAELNRQHELKMLEIIMKYSNPPTQGVQQHPQQQTPPTHQVVSVSQDSHFLDMDSRNDEPSMTWY